MNIVSEQITDTDVSPDMAARAVTNSIIQTIANEMVKLGLTDEIDDDRRLRTLIHAAVLPRIQEMRSHVGEISAEAATAPSFLHNTPIRTANAAAETSVKRLRRRTEADRS